MENQAVSNHSCKGTAFVGGIEEGGKSGKNDLTEALCAICINTCFGVWGM